MTLSNLFIFILLSSGITFGMQNKLPRWAYFKGEEERTDLLGRLLGCAYCCGFHAGYLSMLLMMAAGAFPGAHEAQPFAVILAAALAGATIGYTFDTAMRLIESKIG